MSRTRLPPPNKDAPDDWSHCVPPWPKPPGPEPPPGWDIPPEHWLLEHGFLLKPKRIGHPVEGELAFKRNPAGDHLPRLPWPFESETRAAGTGLRLGRYPRHHHPHCDRQHEDHEPCNRNRHDHDW